MKKATKKVDPKFAAAVKPLVSITHKALEAVAEGEKHLKALGAKVFKVFKKRETFEEGKSAFVEACLWTAPRYAHHAAALKVKISPKDKSAKANAQRDAKAKARSCFGMAFLDIAEYAFGKKNGSGETRGRKAAAAHEKIRKHLEAAKKIAQEAEAPAFVPADVVKGLDAVVAMLPNAIKPETAKPGRRKPQAPTKPTTAKPKGRTKVATRRAKVAGKLQPGTVGLGDAKQTLAGVKPRRTKAKPSTKRDARDMVGAVG